MPNELTPELRFPKFENEWEEKRLGKLFSNSKTKGNDSIPIYSVSQDKGLVPRESLDRNIQKDAESGDNLKVQPNDLVYNTMRMWQGAVGFAVEECMVSPAYVVLSPQKKVDPQFFLYFFERLRTRYLFTIHSHGLTLDRLRLYYKDFSGIKVKVPSYVEQKKITDFLSVVDEKIKTLTKKKTLLEEYKKGVMQRLFSQEIRFKDEQGQDFLDWEEKTLGEIGEIFGGGTPDTTKDEYWNGEINWFTPSELKSKYIVASIRKITKEGLANSSAKLLPPETILLTTRATIGEVSICQQYCTTNQGFQSIIVKKQFSTEYVYYWLKMNTNLLLEKASGSTFPEISRKEILKLKINLPSLLEQQKIASFLTALDEKINKATQQIETAQAFKKGLLQKMFV